jgi:hypothetical protein
MQKAHLYEAIFLFNHGMDEAVRGLERLKRAPDLDSGAVDKVRVLFEAGRADINSHFCNSLEGAETADAADFDKRVRERRKETLDAVKVYEDVQIVEERRRKEGAPPVVRFLTPSEQKSWKKQDLSKSRRMGDKGGNGVGQSSAKRNKERKSGPQKGRASAS